MSLRYIASALLCLLCIHIACAQEKTVADLESIIKEGRRANVELLRPKSLLEPLACKISFPSTKAGAILLNENSLNCPLVRICYDAGEHSKYMSFSEMSTAQIKPSFKEYELSKNGTWEFALPSATREIFKIFDEKGFGKNSKVNLENLKSVSICISFFNLLDCDKGRSSSYKSNDIVLTKDEFLKMFERFKINGFKYGTLEEKLKGESARDKSEQSAKQNNVIKPSN